MEIDCKSLNCTTCCEKYWITLLPEEAKNMAQELTISEEDFIKTYCTLFLQIFPTHFSKNELKIHNKFLPKEIADSLKSYLNYLPDFVLTLPILALKKNESCIMLENGLCKVHNSKPAQCKFFPFLSHEKNPDLKKLYPFCKALHTTDFSEIEVRGEEHYNKMFNYFESIKKEGFLKQWKVIPEQGIVISKGTSLGAISQTQFLKMIAPLETNL